MGSSSPLKASQRLEEIIDLPFDQYQRYRMTTEIVRIIKNGKEGDKLSILDVGGCANQRDGKGPFLPLSLFLPEENLTVLDVVDFKDPLYVKGDGCALHFPDGSFDIVVSNDTLEHIPPSERKEFIENLIRASTISVILSTPYKTQVNTLAENHLQGFIQKRLGRVHRQLKEHIDLGLPEKGEIEEVLKNCGVTFFPFLAGNTYHWFFMMVLKHYLLGLSKSEPLHRRIDRFYNENFWKDCWPPHAYRCHYVIFKEAAGSPFLLDSMAAQFSPSRPSPCQELGERDPEIFFNSILEMVWEFHRKTGRGRLRSRMAAWGRSFFKG